MKKYFFILAAALVALASCQKGGGTGSKYTSIRFKETAINLAQGESQKLVVLYEPTTLDAPVCVWESSNPSVVTVDQNGNISAKEVGVANITATYGEGESALKAACQVTVKTLFDMLVWGDFLVAFDTSDESSKIGQPYEVTSSRGTVYTVQLYEATYYMVDQNIEYVSGTGFVGAGFTSFIDAPIEVIISEGDAKGYYWTNEIIFKDLPTDSAGVCPAGALTDAEKWYAYLTDTTQTMTEADGSAKGAFIHYIDWDYDDEVDYLGFFKSGIIGSYSDGTFYSLDITWLGGACGLAVDETTGTLVEPHAFAEREDQHYELLPTESVSKKPLLSMKNSKELKNLRPVNFQNSKAFIRK